jgi:voltage-gated potassium channel Kch
MRRLKGFKVLAKGINTHLSVAHVVAGANVDQTSVHFVFTGTQNVVPLSKLGIADLLINLTLRTVNRALETHLVIVFLNRLTVVCGLF